MEDSMLVYNIDQDGINYKTYYVFPNKEKGYNFGYLIAFSNSMEENTRLVVETNNFDCYNQDELIKSALNTMGGIGSAIIATKAPVIVPILPNFGKNAPCFQHLSKECFSNNLDEKYKRVDIQVMNMIEDVKLRINKATNKLINDKIFLKGYSSSGEFAKRFALLHPEIVDSLCAGGTIGFLPMPIKKINGISLKYPTGVYDIEELTGRSFNEESYKKIKFFYYVAEKENETKSDTRIDEYGNPVSMYDMTYKDDSVPNEIGSNYRKIFGLNLFERFEKATKVIEGMGYDIKTKIFKGKYHNSLYGKEGLGETANEDIYNFYVNGRILDRDSKNKGIQAI